MSSYLRLEDGVELFYQKDLPKDSKAIVLINHGFAEHLDRYDYISKSLNESGYGVYRYDLRGHGRTKFQKGHIKRFNNFILDADEMVDYIKKENKDLPVFMLGHSMGGLITALYGIKYPDKLKGQIFSGAALGTLPSGAGIKKYILELGNLLIPNKKIKNPIDKSLCSVEEVYTNYLNDPLVLKEATMNFYVEFLVNAVKILNMNKDKYNYPCLITHGEMDKVVPKELSVSFYEKINSRDKEIIIYDNLFHEILNEKEKDQVIDDIVQWLNNRV